MLVAENPWMCKGNKGTRSTRSPDNKARILFFLSEGFSFGHLFSSIVGSIVGKRTMEQKTTSQNKQYQSVVLRLREARVGPVAPIFLLALKSGDVPVLNCRQFVANEDLL